MKFQFTLESQVKQAIKVLFNAEIDEVEFQATRKEFVGDITVVVFPMLRVIKGNPVQIGEAIGAYLKFLEKLFLKLNKQEVLTNYF